MIIVRLWKKINNLIKTNKMEKLTTIQNELKAPKSQYNSFGKYNYRNAEDILEAVKPLLAKYKCLLYLSDEIIYIEGRHYVKATATFIEPDGWQVSVSASAREEQDKKGMDGSQITGASSSYARKYTLNGLFLIDDTKDSDTTNTHDKEPKPATNPQPAPQPKEVKTAPVPQTFDIAGTEELLKTFKTSDEVAKHWAENKTLHSNQDYVSLISKRGKELNGTK